MGANELDVFNPHAVATPDEMKAKVVALQEQLLRLPQADIVTMHSFRPGFYERTIVIPPWTVLTGAEHKTAYQVRLSRGSIAVNMDNGGVRILTAPDFFDVPAGIQRAGHTFEEEVIWTDICPNPDNCRDIEELERRLVNVSDAGLMDDYALLTRIAAQEDYKALLAENNLTALPASDNEIDMPEGYFVEIKPSKIHGKGLFATKDFKAGELICPATAGRYLNHSTNANVMMDETNDDLGIIAVRDVYQNEELLVNYRTSALLQLSNTLKSEV